MLGAKIHNAGFKALVERIIDNDILAVTDKFISDMCTDISSASG